MRLKIMTAILLGVTQLVSASPQTVEIKLKHNSAAEVMVRQQLERLLQSYPLSPWYFTKSIEIDEAAIPHSHPVLTLHTRHWKDDELLLSSFVHEEVHWWLEGKEEVKAAEDDLRHFFPKIPVGFPNGAETEESGYLHLLVNFLEWRSDRELMGELRARQVMEFWTHDHYQVIYQLVLDHPREISAIIEKHHLALPAQPAAAR